MTSKTVEKHPSQLTSISEYKATETLMDAYTKLLSSGGSLTPGEQIFLTQLVYGRVDDFRKFASIIKDLEHFLIFQSSYKGNSSATRLLRKYEEEFTMLQDIEKVFENKPYLWQDQYQVFNAYSDTQCNPAIPCPKEES